MRRSEGLLLECLGCKRMLPRGQFRKVKGKVRSQCRGCEKPGKSARNALRRERARGRGSYSAGDVRRLLVLQNHLCRLCNRHLGITGYHVDHVVALARGGNNVVGNLQLLCPGCNLKKGAR